MPSTELHAGPSRAGATADGPPAGPPGCDDAVTVRALRRRHEPTFTALVERMYPNMRRTARTFVPTDALAEEVVQETWLAVLDGIDRFEGRSTLSTWIFAILVNQAKTRGIRERRSLAFSQFGTGGDEATVDADRFPGPDDPCPGRWAAPPRAWEKPERRLISLELRERLRDALEQLPERQRVVVALRDVEGLPAADVCEMLGLTPRNQRVLLHRGRICLEPSSPAKLQLIIRRAQVRVLAGPSLCPARRAVCSRMPGPRTVASPNRTSPCYRGSVWWAIERWRIAATRTVRPSSASWW